MSSRRSWLRPFRTISLQTARNRSRSELSRKLAAQFFRLRPRLEHLEERVVLDAVGWNVATSGNWNVAANWLDTTTGKAKVPSSTDQVTINQSGVTVTVSDAENAGSLTTASGANLAITAGSLTLVNAATLNGGFDLSGGELTIDTTLTLAGTSAWSGGSIAGAGNLTNMGTLAVANSSTASPLADLVNLTNAGTITQTGGGGIGIGSGLTVSNELGGVYDLQSNGGLTSSPGSGSAPQFLNVGIFQKTAGTGTSLVSSAVAFLNAGGTVDVESGTIAIQSSGGAPGGEEGATFTVASGAVLDLSGPSAGNTLEGTFTGSGAGTVLLESGFLSTGPQGATFDFPAGLFEWTGGTIENNGGLSNQGTITVSGSQNLTFGPGLLDNAGTIIQSSGQFLLDPNTTLLNEAGGLYNLLAGASLGENTSNGGGANPVLANEGTFKKSSGSGSTTFEWDLDNTGTFEVDAGTLNQTGNVIQAAAGALTGGTWVVSGGAALTLQQPGKLTATRRM